MKKVDKYIDLIYKDISGDDEEINITKQEMKNHLLQIIEELKLEGKSEEESIDIAISRFGNTNQIRNELKKIYEIEKRPCKKIIKIAIIMLIISVSSFLLSKMLFYRHQHIVGNLLNSIEKKFTVNDEIPKKEIGELFEKNKKKFMVYNDELKYVDVYKYPKNTDKDKLLFKMHHIKDAEYTYPSIDVLNEELARVGYLGNFGTSNIIETSNNSWYISVSVRTPGLFYSIVDIFKYIGLGCFVLYWILFGVWANMKTEAIEGYNPIWFILLFVFNILAYEIFLEYSKKRDLKLKTL
ncbi:hypothetical protein K144313037_13550 [Clostridium tetani]|uniref:permease prefix domain 1-containing protein n=1 Tax=Clostridium tetani TaxID=1513 RepID=UPI000D20B4BC|nr:permease prefix domain 1-containing protein [Clostridium tetani]AVP54086.1 hypothetical protein C3B72_02735 [Clostridium tetani]RXI76389.1 hypothetical protein DP128_07655 [Clostridium tetani]WFN60891.1 permease prefix domain 1-containing protein [Clostridium tetani]SUY55960.1 Uncharacterised protein [Clostridium tetani]BDR69943.1 hypothetical protein K144313037_13550 [Clostridium tetani]